MNKTFINDLNKLDKIQDDKIYINSLLKFFEKHKKAINKQIETNIIFSNSITNYIKTDIYSRISSSSIILNKLIEKYNNTKDYYYLDLFINLSFNINIYIDYNYYLNNELNPFNYFNQIKDLLGVIKYTINRIGENYDIFNNIFWNKDIIDIENSIIMFINLSSVLLNNQEINNLIDYLDDKYLLEPMTNNIEDISYIEDLYKLDRLEQVNLFIEIIKQNKFIDFYKTCENKVFNYNLFLHIMTFKQIKLDDNFYKELETIIDKYIDQGILSKSTLVRLNKYQNINSYYYYQSIEKYFDNDPEIFYNILLNNLETYNNKDIFFKILSSTNNLNINILDKLEKSNNYLVKTVLYLNYHIESPDFNINNIKNYIGKINDKEKFILIKKLKNINNDNILKIGVDI